MQTIVATAPAKLNLFLGVGRLGADGYHEVCTVVHALELADRVSLESSDRLEVRMPGAEACPPEQNLAWRAAVMLGEAVGRFPRARITIEKAVPVGAGLGGGSSDAAAVLLGLSALWDIEVGGERLLSLTRALGSDVPFFLHGGAARLGGRGDVLEEALPPVEVPILLVKPLAALSTDAVYQAFDCAPIVPGDPDIVEAALRAGDARKLGRGLANNLTEAACRLEAGVADALRWAGQAPGVLGAAMTGSGSAVFAVCRDYETALALERQADARGWWSRATRTVRSGVTIRS
jgi:4-diphosphocytidyl-2-C-methyl-D-erythritol kinase